VRKNRAPLARNSSPTRLNRVAHCLPVILTSAGNSFLRRDHPNATLSHAGQRKRYCASYHRGGLAGCEAAWQARRPTWSSCCNEMRPARGTEAHATDGLAELVCSNSFRSDRLRKQCRRPCCMREMRRAGSLILRAADLNRLPAGGALAVDRERFSRTVTRAIEEHPRIETAGRRSTRYPTSPSLPRPGRSLRLRSPNRIRALTGEDSLAFFDAIAPVVHKDSVDFSVGGCSRATTRWGLAAVAPTTSTVLLTRINTARSLRR